jgi:uncharacterized phiE125 gp8 family phage protein
MNEKTRLVTPPSEEPLTVAQFRAQSRLDVIPEEDNHLLSIISTARQVAENTTWLALAPATYETFLDGFPGGAITLDPSPVQSVTSVTYTDKEGNPQTLDPSSYQVDLVGYPARILPLNGWPETIEDRVNTVRVLYVSGYAPADVPPQIRHAIAMLCDHFYQFRGELAPPGGVQEIPMAAKALLQQVNMRRF